jgi:hypothetical protein
VKEDCLSRRRSMDAMAAQCRLSSGVRGRAHRPLLGDTGCGATLTAESRIFRSVRSRAMRAVSPSAGVACFGLIDAWHSLKRRRESTPPGRLETNERVLDGVLRIRDAFRVGCRLATQALSHSSRRGANPNAFFAFAFDAPRSRVP